MNIHLLRQGVVGDLAPWALVRLAVVLLAFTMIPANESKGEAHFSEGQIQALSRELVVGQVVRSFCSSCGAAAFEEKVIETIEIRQEKPFYLKINDKFQYLDLLYVYRDGEWRNLAAVLGIDRDRESEILDPDVPPISAVTGIQGYFVGTIGSQLRIQMDLQSDWFWKGTYFYESVGKPLQVSVRTVRVLPGERPRLALELSEAKIDSERSTGFFRGVLDPSEGVFQGIWSKPDASRSHSFHLRKVAAIISRARENSEGQHFQSFVRFESQTGVWQSLNSGIQFEADKFFRRGGPADPHEVLDYGDSWEQAVTFYSESLLCLKETGRYWGGARPNTGVYGQCYVQRGGVPAPLDLQTIFLESDETFGVLGKVLRNMDLIVDDIKKSDIKTLWLSGTGLELCVLRDDSDESCWAHRADMVTVPLTALGSVIDPEGPLARWSSKRQ